LLSWSARQLLRFVCAQNSGMTPEQAAVAAGSQAFRAREMVAQTRGVGVAELEGWMRVLAETDLALKGSRRPPRAVIESAILTMTVGVSK